MAPPTATVSIGGTLTLSAQVLDASGGVVEAPRVSWASADPAVAEVSSEGVVTGRTLGTVLIAASSRGKDAFARITVNPIPVASVRLSTSHRAMMVGQTVLLTAETLDSDGRVLSDRPVNWSSSDPAVATVTGTGMVTALAAGAAIITASSEGRSAVATITVSLVPVVSVVVTPENSNLVVGQTTELTAQLKDESGNILTGRGIVWSTDRPSVATVTSEGLVTAVSSGTATIMATSEGRSGTAGITVAPRPVSAVIVSPEQVTIFARQTVQLSALVTDDRGQVLNGRPVTFSSSNTQVATVSTQGLVTGIAAGSAIITATSEGASGRATITITPDPVAAVEVNPSTASVIVGSTVQLTAIARNISGQALTGRPVAWSSSSPALASVSATGVVTGTAPGNAVIIATIEGKQASATVTVRLVPVANITVTPATASLVPGQSVPLTATTRDGAGNVLSGRVVGWSSSNNAVATVSANGVVTGVGTGSATITASSEGVSGSAAVTVGAVPVASVTVSPAQSTLTVGQTVTLAATPKDAGGQTLSGRSVAWSSSAPGVATVSGSGVVTGVSSGSATITATVDGVPGTAAVTVSAPVAASVTVSPSTATVGVGSSTTLTATVLASNGNVISGAPVTWSSSNTAIATVSSTGVVSGVAAGSATITARSGTATGTAAITVTAPVAASVTISPSTATVNLGSSTTLTATVRAANGSVISGAPVTWSSSNTAVATVSSGGVVSAVGAGSATITATSGTASGTASITVPAPQVARVVVTPSNPRIKEGETVQLTAALYDANDRIITGVAVTWTSSNTSRATVDSNGLVRGIRDGNVTITASAGGKSGSTTVRVDN